MAGYKKQFFLQRSFAAAPRDQIYLPLNLTEHNGSKSDRDFFGPSALWVVTIRALRWWEYGAR
jgi:hypothetical protein